MSVIKLAPALGEIFGEIQKIIKKIQPGQRAKILLPREYSHDDDGKSLDWDALEELQMEFRGSNVPPNVFVTLRFDQESEEEEVTVDICHF